MPLHPATEAILRYFDYDHLPDDLQAVSRPVHDLAHDLADRLDGPEVTVGLRKLLEAKDCFVRAALLVIVPEPIPEPPPPAPLPSGLPTKLVGAYWRTDGPHRLTDADHRINVFLLAFAKSAASGTGSLYFTPDEGGGITETQMRVDIEVVKARGAKVILSIGGSNDGGIVMRTPAQVTEAVDSLNEICDRYGCDGIDWDLEHGGEGTDLESLKAASAQLKAVRGTSFTVSVSAEPGLALYEQFALSSASVTVGSHTYTGPVCDLYAPQFYDYAQTVERRKAGIVANATKMVGMGLPAFKYAIGTTYGGSYLGESGQMAPSAYLAAYNTLKAAGIVARGAVVWDMTVEARNGYPFAVTFGDGL